MLPSQGLFKEYLCPLYENGNCTRPFCHYKHVKKAKTNAPPDYTPTPIKRPLTLLTLDTPLLSSSSSGGSVISNNSNGSSSSSSKKAKLEYTPIQPAINNDSKCQKYINIENNIPVYKPSNIIKNGQYDGSSTGIHINDDDYDTNDDFDTNEQLEDESNHINSTKSNDDHKLEPISNNDSTEKEEEKGEERNKIFSLHNSSVKKIIFENSEHKNQNSQYSSKNEEFTIDEEKLNKNDVDKKVNKSSSSSQVISNQDQKSDTDKIKHRDKDKRRSSSSSSSSSRHGKDNHKSKSSDTQHHRSTSRSSSSSSNRNDSSHRRRHSTSSSSSSKDDGHKLSSSSSNHHRHHHHDKKSSSSDKHKSSSSSSSKSRSSSSKSKSKSSHKSSDDETKPKTSLSLDDFNFKIPAGPLLSSNDDDLAIDDDDEDDVMEQCKMIFEEFNKSNTSTTNSRNDEEPIRKPHLPLKRPFDVDTEDEKYDECSKKKRVAHENAVKIDKPISQGVLRKPNHTNNAMQSIYHRQEIIAKKQAEEAAAAASAAVAAVKEAEEKLREAEEMLRLTTVKQQQQQQQQKQLTPLIPRSYLQPGRPARSIAPVSNILALEKAKKKVEELKAQKSNNAILSTPIRTATKGTGRVAHKTTVSTDTRIAPPVLEANSTKISYNIRMQYYNMMVTQCLNIYPNCEDAWDRAQTEELAVFKKCTTPIIYKSSALLTINKLKKESIDAGNINTDKTKTISHDVILAGKLGQSTSWSTRIKSNNRSNSSADPFDKLPPDKAYELIYELILTDDQLRENGYPRSGGRPGLAVIKPTYSKPKPPSEDERYCCRCSKLFNISMYDEQAIDECNYHPKGTGYRRGFPDNSHLCCQQPSGTPGCTYANYHVTDYMDFDNLKGFVTTIERDDSDNYVPTKKDIYALDCEMCYTTHGVELTRVTVVDINSRVVYDGLVKPENKIIDYNTVYSGINEEMLENETRTLRDVQAVLLSMFHSKTILIGHSLESDLKALKLIHNNVVDTSILYPHRQGPPKKRALKNLCIENLKRIIQENEKGHDSAEDAEVCIQLVKYYLRNKISSN